MHRPVAAVQPEEFLVGKEPTDYSMVQQLAKDFRPYSDLWLTTKDWFVNHVAWMNNPWEQLNAVKLESDFEYALKTFAGVVRYFKDKGFPQINKIADHMKAQVDTFKPFVPLAVALRKDGMKDCRLGTLSAARSDSTYGPTRTSPSQPSSTRACSSTSKSARRSARRPPRSITSRSP